MKRFLLVALMAFFIVGCSSSDAPLTGQATHGTYNAFSAPENGFTVGGDLVRSSDTAVYRTAWYSVNGSAWQQFTLSGSAYGTSSSWLAGAASVPLPAALSGPGEHYLIVYSCTWSSEAWDCHGDTPAAGGWQLQVITISSASCGGSTCAPDEYCSAQNVCLLSVPGNTYFVAVEGNDSWPGNFTHPWGTWKKGFESVRPGDIVYIRGGTYIATGIAGNYININYVEGTEDHQLYFFNYPGENPILDGSSLSPGAGGWNTAINIAFSHWFNFRGLTVRNFHQYVVPGLGRTQLATAFSGYGCSNFHYENCVAHDIGGRGFMYMSIGNDKGWTKPDNSSWINCDSYNNVDALSFYTVNETIMDNAGNGADGYFIQVLANPPGYALIEGCRSWHNSDDGFNFDGDAVMEIRNCWSFNNSYPSIEKSEGNGFKFDSQATSTTNRFVTNCIAANNSGFGYNPNNALSGEWPRQEIYHSISYNDYYGSLVQNCGETPVPDASANVIRNTIFYDDVWAFLNVPWLQARTDYFFTEDHNTWRTIYQYPYYEINPAYDVTDEDFVSLDYRQLARPRKADGSLPDIEFGHLRADSDLIDGGTLIPGYHCATSGDHPGEDCQEWYGVAPDLGPFEYEG